jgi:hypothetical protein
MNRVFGLIAHFATMKLNYSKAAFGYVISPRCGLSLAFSSETVQVACFIEAQCRKTKKHFDFGSRGA